MANKWMPIESAPRDETRVLVHIPGRLEPQIAWFGLDWNAAPGDEPCWLYGTGDDFSCGFYFCPCEPSHWMPLPEPPDGE